MTRQTMLRQLTAIQQNVSLMIDHLQMEETPKKQAKPTRRQELMMHADSGTWRKPASLKKK